MCLLGIWSWHLFSNLLPAWQGKHFLQHVIQLQSEGDKEGLARPIFENHCSYWSNDGYPSATFTHHFLQMHLHLSSIHSERRTFHLIRLTQNKCKWGIRKRNMVRGMGPESKVTQMCIELKLLVMGISCLKFTRHKVC